MYPNPQDALPLPSHPDLDQYRKRAKELVAAARAGDNQLLDWTSRWIDALARLNTTAPRLSDRDRPRRAQQVAQFARDRLQKSDFSLSQAQFVLARAHGFESWPKFVHHVEELSRAASHVSSFERAADAIVAGDLPTLERLLKEEPELIRARSSREHNATLLHYVAANGVENYRQVTPANIVPIARHLLDAGAEVDAEAEMYGGGATTFGLVVTSAHPRLAGVQIELADLLLARGARMGKRIIRDCLANGCPEAAMHLARLGAPLSFIDAAGIGRTDLVREAFEQSGGVPQAEQGGAMVMAGWYGQRETVELLMQLGVDPGALGETDGQTALHVAAYQGDAELVELLLRHEAPVNVTDAVHGTPPLVWALHAWLVENRRDPETYIRIAMALVGAGAEVKREWLDDDRLRASPELYSALLKATTG